MRKNIDATALPPCAQNIVNKIKDLTQNDFAAIIALLGGTNSPYKVNIVSVPQSAIGANTLAETSWTHDPANPLVTYPNQFTISISSQYLTTGTQLSIATTVMHEIIHAYFYSLIDNQAINGVVSPFPQLWENFIGGLPGDSQYDLLAEKFRKIIASCLQEFNTNIPLNSNQIPQQIYMDLAMVGLYSSATYNTFSASEQNRISAILQAEQNNTTASANGTTYSPLGVPCN